MTDSNNTKKCPYCDETIASAAIKCKHCSSMLGNMPIGDSSNNSNQNGTENKSRFPVKTCAFSILLATAVAGFALSYSSLESDVKKLIEAEWCKEPSCQAMKITKSSLSYLNGNKYEGYIDVKNGEEEFRLQVEVEKNDSQLIWCLKDAANKSQEKSKILFPDQLLKEQGRRCLDQVGLSIALYFADGGANSFKNAELMFNKDLKYLQKITDIPDRGLPPVSKFEDFDLGKSDIVPLWQNGDEYRTTNRSDYPIALLRQELIPGYGLLLMGDGSVQSFHTKYKDTESVILVLKKNPNEYSAGALK